MVQHEVSEFWMNAEQAQHKILFVGQTLFVIDTQEGINWNGNLVSGGAFVLCLESPGFDSKPIQTKD